MNEVLSALFNAAGPAGCVIIGCFALTAIGCFAVYKLIQSKREKSREEIDNRSAENDKRFALLEQRVKRCEDGLAEGANRFESLDRNLDEVKDRQSKTLSSIDTLNGRFEMFLKMQGYVK